MSAALIGIVLAVLGQCAGGHCGGGGWSGGGWSGGGWATPIVRSQPIWPDATGPVVSPVVTPNVTVTSSCGALPAVTSVSGVSPTWVWIWPWGWVQR